MRRVNVLYLRQEGTYFLEQNDQIAAIGDRHNLSIYDYSKPLSRQFEFKEVVIDMGGSAGTHDMIDAAKDAQLWQVFGNGLDHVDLEYMKNKGLVITHCPGFNSGVALAEHAMLLMLMLSRNIHKATDNFKAGLSYEPVGKELEDSILAIVGFGASGQELARRAKAFGMRVYAIDVRKIDSQVLANLNPDFIGTIKDLDHVIKECDFISPHLPLNVDTRHIIDTRRIGLMKSSACIINVARGGLVDEEAMHEALLSGKLGGAGIDVFSSEPPDPTLPVYQLPNVFVTPHIAGVTLETSQKRAKVMAENVDRFAQGQQPLYRVDNWGEALVRPPNWPPTYSR